MHRSCRGHAKAAMRPLRIYVSLSGLGEGEQHVFNVDVHPGRFAAAVSTQPLSARALRTVADLRAEQATLIAGIWLFIATIALQHPAALLSVNHAKRKPKIRQQSSDVLPGQAIPTRKELAYGTACPANNGATQ